LPTADIAAKAREVDEDTPARRRRVLGDDHPHTLWSATNLKIDMQLLEGRKADRQRISV
jgi:hypothetical protein